MRSLVKVKEWSNASLSLYRQSLMCVCINRTNKIVDDLPLKKLCTPKNDRSALVSAVRLSFDMMWWEVVEYAGLLLRDVVVSACTLFRHTKGHSRHDLLLLFLHE